MGLMEKIFGDLNEKEVKKIEKIVDKVEALDGAMAALTDEELQAKTPQFRERLAAGETLDDILPEAFAVCREGAWRALGMKHFRVQLIGGVVLHQGRISEMKTGEGKTLVATLAAYLNALEGKGVHVITVNDYLAKRDAEWMGKLYTFLGLTVGCVVHGISNEERKAAYRADITYGTNNEFGFDYLRDNMVIYEEELMQRELNYAIICLLYTSTTGEAALVPKSISTVIDLGNRSVEPNSIYKVARAIGVEDPFESEAAKRRMENLVVFNPGLERILGERSYLSVQLNGVLKLMKQGIVITDMAGKIYLANDMAGKMLETRGELLKGFRMTDIFPEFNESSRTAFVETLSERLISVNGREVIATVSDMEVEGERKGYIIVLEYFNKTEDRQHKLRSKIRGYGHKAAYTFDQILGESEAIEAAKKIAMRMARSESSICLFGESGTGKELFAQSIHNYSSRKDYLFVAINCSALPENLLESELYGYEEGAFSGAKKGGKIGLFELAHKGTLFLDEIGELPMQMQAKLLRAIEEQKILKVGGRSMIDVDVRVICATNRDLEKMVEEGSFRQDLYYRLCVLPVHIPPLRSREGDLSLIHIFVGFVAYHEAITWNKAVGVAICMVGLYFINK